MGGVPKSYVRAIELQLQRAGARFPDWVTGVCPCLSQEKQVHRVGADPWQGVRTWQWAGWPVATAQLLNSVLCNCCNLHTCNCVSFLHLNTSMYNTKDQYH